jgi:hypothetical protein
MLLAKIAFTNSLINATKTISNKKSKLVHEYSNKDEVFENYLNKTQNENLILRFQFLTEFIDKTKGDKVYNFLCLVG